MLNRYYEQELHNLRSLAAEFGRRNPALAPLLGSAAAVDADVERLLEGVAFMTGLVRQRLDDDFPEFVQSLAQLMFPQFLRPVPCMTIMQYSPRSVTGETLQVPVGTTFLLPASAVSARYSMRFIRSLLSLCGWNTPIGMQASAPVRCRRWCWNWL